MAVDVMNNVAMTTGGMSFTRPATDVALDPSRCHGSTIISTMPP